MREPNKRKNQRQQSIPKDIRPVDFPPTVSNDPFLSSVYGGSSTGIKSTSIDCMFKVKNKNNRTRCKMYSKLIIKRRERRQNAQENTWTRVSNLIKACNFIKIETRAQVFSCEFWRRSVVFIVNLKHISHLVLVFLLLTLSRQMPAGIRCEKDNSWWKSFLSLFDDSGALAKIFVLPKRSLKKFLYENFTSIKSFVALVVRVMF